MAMASPQNQYTNVDIFDAYFRRADLDRDCRSSGNEAVAFFQGSGHPNKSLRSSLNFSSIEPLNGGNYKKWRQGVEIMLGLMDLDLALRETEPAAVTNTSTTEERLKFERWHKANRMSLMVRKRSMSEIVRGGIPDSNNAKDFLEAVGAKFKMSEKAEMGNLMTTLTSLKFDGNGSVREHILKMVNAAGKLNDLDVPVDETFVVHMALNSLPESFEQLKISYNTQKEKWALDEMISICVNEENRIKKGKADVVNFVQVDNGKKPMVYSGKNYKPYKLSNSHAIGTPSSSKGSQAFKVNVENIKCYFCKKYGHMKRDCDKSIKWANKKGFHKKDYNKK